jgi:hypothetical protein
VIGTAIDEKGKREELKAKEESTVRTVFEESSAYSPGFRNQDH